MSGPNAASPASHGRDTRSIEHLRTQPGDRILLACPACGSPDHLVQRERVVTERPIESVWHVGVTDPEVDSCDWDDPAVLVDTAQRIELLGVRCGKCHYAYTGPRPLGHLTAAKETP